MKKIIGFATQFYTIWDYEAVPQYKTDSYGNHHQTGVNHNYYYIKNVSTDIDKVKALFPNVEIDTELRGTSSFTRNEKLDLPENYFWGGKYAGKLIDDILEIDFKYCLWSAENYNMPYITNHPKYIAHFEAIAKAEQAEINSKELLKVGDVVELEFITNGYNADEEYTECWTEANYNDVEVVVNCNGVKPVSGMYPYLMPVINGKTQKTKGKKLTVTIIEVLETNIYAGVVKQFIKVA
jgi:hypothetical protein